MNESAAVVSDVRVRLPEPLRSQLVDLLAYLLLADLERFPVLDETETTEATR